MFETLVGGRSQFLRPDKYFRSVDRSFGIFLGQRVYDRSVGAVTE